MIGIAIKVARKVRKACAHLSIVFGGWHPILVADQTLQPDFVCLIIRGQGEFTPARDYPAIGGRPGGNTRRLPPGGRLRGPREGKAWSHSLQEVC